MKRLNMWNNHFAKTYSEIDIKKANVPYYGKVLSSLVALDKKENNNKNKSGIVIRGKSGDHYDILKELLGTELSDYITPISMAMLDSDEQIVDLQYGTTTLFFLTDKGNLYCGGQYTQAGARTAKNPILKIKEDVSKFTYYETDSLVVVSNDGTLYSYGKFVNINTNDLLSSDFNEFSLFSGKPIQVKDYSTSYFYQSAGMGFGYITADDTLKVHSTKKMWTFSDVKKFSMDKFRPECDVIMFIKNDGSLRSSVGYGSGPYDQGLIDSHLFGNVGHKAPGETVIMSNVKNYVNHYLNTFILTNDGSLYVLGDRSHGQFNSIQIPASFDSFTPLLVMSNVVKFAATDNHTFAEYNTKEKMVMVFLTNDGTLYVGGDYVNSTGQRISINNVKDFYLDTNTQLQAPALYVLLNNNDLYVLGENSYGRFGIGKADDSMKSFTFVMGNIKSIITSSPLLCLFLTTDDKLYNIIPEGGVPLRTYSAFPTTGTNMTIALAKENVKQIIATLYGVAILTNDGNVYVAGKNQAKGLNPSGAITDIYLGTTIVAQGVDSLVLKSYDASSNLQLDAPLSDFILNEKCYSATYSFFVKDANGNLYSSGAGDSGEYDNFQPKPEQHALKMVNVVGHNQ